jgi:hypothetical protein
MANGADLILEFKSDQERYFLQQDQNGNPIPVLVKLEAKLFEGGESSGLSDHTKTVGAPVDNATLSVQITSPDGQKVAGRLEPIGNGIYTINLQTTLVGNYDISVIAADNVPDGDKNNSQYLITAEHSFYISPFVNPTQLDGKLYIEKALAELKAIITKYCPSNNNCNLDNTTKKNINSAISLISTALTYFGTDGNHLKTNKGLSFYANLTSAVNNIYSYVTNTDFGRNIDNALEFLFQGSFKLAEIARDDAEKDGACKVSNCAELLKNANTELGKALREYDKENYVNAFNHLTNTWKFAQNVMGANLKKESGDNESVSVNIPTEYGLDQNYPNPFNPSTRINYQLPENSFVSVKVYDILGNLIATLVDEEVEAGFHSVNWNAGNLSSGVYFYTINSGSFTATKKLMLLK